MPFTKITRPAIRSLTDAIRYGAPTLPERSQDAVKQEFQMRNAQNFTRSIRSQIAFDQRDNDGLKNHLGAIGHLWLAKMDHGGRVQDYGLVSCRVVTNAGVAYIVDALQNLVEMENMKYHAIGTGSTAENVSNVSLASELTTQYSTANTRIAGTAGEKSGAANVYETTATLTVSASVGVTEHGIFSTPGANSGVLLDRSVFSVINLAAGESLQGTYNLTFPAGG